MISLALAATLPGILNGTLWEAGEQCFAIERQGERIGTVMQRIEPVSYQGRDYWNVTIRQSLPARNFEMVDVAVLDARTLRPWHFRNYRNGELHVDLAYKGSRIERTVYGETQAVDEIATDEPLLDANIWGPLMRAMPLERGAGYTLPAYHYDRGITRFEVAVIGEDEVDTLDGPRAAWQVAMKLGDGNPVTYLVAKDDGTELGVDSPMFAQRLLPNCDR
ncbi:hypothetical protein [Sphingomicrobium clamense]|uniref:DUF3108 domain-containing protein n=1 Tax=Sphingomicrobium clamense TaxID=2851013 RepID=A0ABS6V475_9SPHN|nr:hypothetical protein [Sphingomicrobium sp. B8]MBW0144359.1 hypothetical protein [Sphingomicrobium sp. B8]